MSRNPAPVSPGDGESVRWTSFAVAFICCGLVWMPLTEWDVASLVVGLPTAVLAGYLYARTRKCGFVVPALVPLARFLPYFLWESLLSGVDIAVRVLSPRIRVAPGVFGYDTVLKGQEARVFFANTVSLIPGTLSVMFEGDRLHVHTIDMREPNEANLRRLEGLVAALFRERAENGKGAA